MLNIRKRLTIQIEESHDNEEEIQMLKLKNEGSLINCDYNSNDCKIKQSDENKHKIKELNHPYINQLLNYMESENSGSDLSYTWLSRVQTLNFLVKSIHINSPKTLEMITFSRDLNSEYKLIKILTEDSKHKESLVTMKKGMSRNNRYNDILPYKYNVACIADDLGKNYEFNLDDLYVNASFIDGPLPEDYKFFIATQGPLSNTISKFWKLVFYQDVKLIVMLCRLEEDLRKKCECYWPTKETSKSFNDIEVFLEAEDFLLKNSLIKREFIIRFSGIEKRVTSLQMVNWPDHNAPEESNGFETVEYIISGINEVKLINPNSPVLIHCSAGTGRTGTFIAIYNLIRSFNTIKYINQGLESKKKRIKPFMSIFNIVRKLREQRMGMVASYAQYKFIYDFIIEYTRRNIECIEM